MDIKVELEVVDWSIFCPVYLSVVGSYEQCNEGFN